MFIIIKLSLFYVHLHNNIMFTSNVLLFRHFVSMTTQYKPILFYVTCTSLFNYMTVININIIFTVFQSVINWYNNNIYNCVFLTYNVTYYLLFLCVYLPFPFSYYSHVQFNHPPLPQLHSTHTQIHFLLQDY